MSSPICRDLPPDRRPPWRPAGSPPGPGSAGSRGSSPIVDARDPNEKTGPGGFGPAHFIAAQHAFAYRIDFENEYFGSPANRSDRS